MKENPGTGKESFLRLLFRVSVPALISIMICIGSAIGTSILLTSRLEERVASIKDSLDRHDQTRHTEQLRLAERLDNHEQRLSRLEAHYDAVQESLREISSDVKILLRGGLK